jgi:hypothetical protein
MKVSGFASAPSRRLVIAFGIAAAVAGATGAGLVAQGAAPAAAAAPDPLKFSTGTGATIWHVKPEATADFEGFWSAIKAKFSASSDAEQKMLGDGLKVYKVDAGTPPGPDGVMYLLVADPAPKTVSYNPSPSLLYDSKLFSADEAKALFTKLSGALAPGQGISPLPLVKAQ